MTIWVLHLGPRVPLSSSGLQKYTQRESTYILRYRRAVQGGNTGERYRQPLATRTHHASSTLPRQPQPHRLAWCGDAQPLRVHRCAMLCCAMLCCAVLTWR